MFELLTCKRPEGVSKDQYSEKAKRRREYVQKPINLKSIVEKYGGQDFSHEFNSERNRELCALSIEDIVNITIYRLMSGKGMEFKSPVEPPTSVLEITYAFCLRTAEYGTKLNLVSAVNFEEALRFASLYSNYTIEEITSIAPYTLIEPVDEHNDGQWNKFPVPISHRDITTRSEPLTWNTLEELKDILPPLFGVPISVKDVYLQANHDSTCGITRLCFAEHQKDGEIVAILRELGCIPMVRGTVPQILMCCETINRITGSACCPHDITRNTGGSSGGDAGIVALGGAPLGWGSDAGGSIRIPCHNTGLIGFKSTIGRIVSKGNTNFLKKDNLSGNAIQSVTGPIVRSMDDLTFFMKSFFSYKGCLISKAQDPRTLVLPWKLFPTTRKNKLGFILSDKFFDPSLAALRVTLETLSLAVTKGFDLVPLDKLSFQILTDLRNDLVEKCDITNPAYCIIDSYTENIGQTVNDLFVPAINSTGLFQHNLAALENEQPILPLRLQYVMAQFPNWTLPLVSAISKPFLDKRDYNQLEKLTTSPIPASKYHIMLARINHIRNWWTKKVSCNVDGVVLPTLPLPALKHGQSTHILCYCSYTMLANVLDVPTGSFLAGYVDKSEEHYTPQWFWNNVVSNWSKTAEECMVGSAGLPLGVSIMGTPYEEETVIELMELLSVITPKKIIDPELLKDN